MRKTVWLAATLAPYCALVCAALVVGAKLAAADPDIFIEGKGIYGGFLLLSITLSVACAITAALATARWQRTKLEDPEASSAYGGFAAGSAISVVLFAVWGASIGLGIAYTIARVV